MVDYSNGKIYKIWSVLGDDIYIGSTTEALSRRMAFHRSCHITKRPCFISSSLLFDKYGIENCQNWLKVSI